MNSDLKKPAGGPGRYVAPVLIILVAVGAIAAFGFYQNEIGIYLKFQGWNLEPVKSATRKFVQAAAAGDGDAVASLLLTEDGTGFGVVRENGRLTGLRIVEPQRGPQDRALKQLAPSPDGNISEPRLVLLDEGGVAIDVTYPGSHRLDLRWDRAGSDWKLKSVGWTDVSLFQ